MHKKTTYFLIVLFLVAFLGYTALDRMTFKVPQNPTEGASCDITPGDFTNTGQIKYSANETWWISFTRKEEYLSAFSAALAITFMGYALTKLRQIGTAAITGGVAGGSILVGLTLCFSCLAPFLAAVGLGLFANLGLTLVAIPKWLVALNTLILTMFGYLYVSRKAASCPVAARPKSTVCTTGGIQH